MSVKIVTAAILLQQAKLKISWKNCISVEPPTKYYSIRKIMDFTLCK